MTQVTQISANDVRLANLAQAFGGTEKSVFTDFLKIVNASPDYVQQLNAYLDSNDEYITVGTKDPDGIADGKYDGATNTLTIYTQNSLFGTHGATNGYFLAIVIAHELGHRLYFTNGYEAIDGGNGADTPLNEASADKNAYDLMKTAVRTLQAQDDVTSTQDPTKNLFQTYDSYSDSPISLTGQPIVGYTGQRELTNLFRSFDDPNLPFTAECGLATLCMGLAANYYANEPTYKSFFASQGASATDFLLSQNGFSFYSDPSSPSSILVKDTTGALVQTFGAQETNNSVVIDSTSSSNSKTTFYVNGTGAIVSATNSQVSLADGASADIVGGGNTIALGTNANVTITSGPNAPTGAAENYQKVAANDTIFTGAIAHCRVAA